MQSATEVTPKVVSVAVVSSAGAVVAAGVVVAVGEGDGLGDGEAAASAKLADADSLCAADALVVVCVVACVVAAGVPLPAAGVVGSVVDDVVSPSAGAITISITSDTMTLAGAGTTGNRTLAANGIATAIKMTATTWQINGTGLT